MTLNAGIEYADPEHELNLWRFALLRVLWGYRHFWTVLDNLASQQSRFQQGRHEVRSQLVSSQAHDSCTDV